MVSIKKSLFLLFLSVIFLSSCATIPRQEKELKQECMCGEGYDKSHRITNQSALRKIKLSNKSYFYFDRAMQYDLLYPPTKVRRGKQYPYLMKWFDQAVADYTQVIALNPGFADAYYNRGILFFTGCRDAEALKDFNRAIELDPSFYQALNNRGLMLIWLPKRVPAYEKDLVKDFSKALEINPKYGFAYYNRAVHYSVSRPTDEVISDLTKAIEFISSDEEQVIRFRPHQYRAKIYMKKGLYKEAIDDLNACLSIIPFENCPIGRLLLPLWTIQERAKCYMILGEYDKAWDDVHTFESRNTIRNAPPIDQALLQELKQKSGREK